MDVERHVFDSRHGADTLSSSGSKNKPEQADHLLVVLGLGSCYRSREVSSQTAVQPYIACVVERKLTNFLPSLTLDCQREARETGQVVSLNTTGVQPRRKPESHVGVTKQESPGRDPAN